MVQRRMPPLTAFSSLASLARGAFRSLLLLTTIASWTLPAMGAQQQKVYLYAAASLQAPLEIITADYTRKSGNQVVLVTGGSGDLARQIEQGAPANLFISANTEWADYLQTRKLIEPGTRVNLLGNSLVAVSSPCRDKTTAPIAELLQLTHNSRVAMANPDSAPAGQYAKQALIKLGLWQQVEKRAAFAEDVRSALNWVVRCESDLGFVYKTDAMAGEKLGLYIAAEFPAGSHGAIVYPMSVIAQKTPAHAHEFAKYLADADAFAVFEKFGFTKP